MSVEEDRRIVERLIANDPKMIEEFFFVRNRAMLTYIGECYFPVKESPESIIGEFYGHLSANDWHKLRIFQFSCSLDGYVSLIASRYFQHKRDTRLRTYGDESEWRTERPVEPEDRFTQKDIERIIEELKPLDRLLIERILLKGYKPREVIAEARAMMDPEKLATMSADQVRGYVYTRYAKVRKYLRERLKAMGYGA